MTTDTAPLVTRGRGNKAFEDRAALAAEVARLQRLHDAAYVVVALADSALMDHDLGGGSHLDGTMEQLREALDAYVTVRDGAGSVGETDGDEP